MQGEERRRGTNGGGRLSGSGGGEGGGVGEVSLGLYIPKKETEKGVSDRVR